MISVEIPNDIAEYKPKLILGLTGRQVTCVILTAVFIFLDLKFLKPYIGETLSLGLAIVPALIAVLFGWKEPYGMPFEKYLQSVFVQAFVAPKMRKCKTTSSMVVPCDKYFVPISDDALPKEVLECVNYVRERTNNVTSSDEQSNTSSVGKSGKLSKGNKKKYKKSKLAML